MCTNIATRARITGSAKTAGGWLAVEEATVGYDHATHLWAEHALRLDFVGADGAGRVAVELDLASAKLLLERLGEVIAAADASGVDG